MVDNLNGALPGQHRILRRHSNRQSWNPTAPFVGCATGVPLATSIGMDDSGLTRQCFVLPNRNFTSQFESVRNGSPLNRITVVVVLDLVFLRSDSWNHLMNSSGLELRSFRGCNFERGETWVVQDHWKRQRVKVFNLSVGAFKNRRTKRLSEQV